MDLDSLALLVLFLGLWLGAKGLKAAARTNPDLREVAENLTRGAETDQAASAPPVKAEDQQTPTSAGKP